MPDCLLELSQTRRGEGDGIFCSSNNPRVGSNYQCERRQADKTSLPTVVLLLTSQPHTATRARRQRLISATNGSLICLCLGAPVVIKQHTTAAEHKCPP